MDEAAINKRFWMVVIVAVVLVALIGVGFFFTYQKFNSLTAEFNEKTEKMASLKKTHADLKQKEALMEENKAQAEMFEKYLPGEEDVPAMLKTIAEKATNNDLLLDYARVDNPKKTTTKEKALYETWVFSLKMMAQYKDIITFVNEVENLDRFVMVNQLKLAQVKLEFKGVESEDPTIEDLLKPQYLECSILIYTFVYAGDK
jgi:Tfp pilus assembly protein PilO